MQVRDGCCLVGDGVLVIVVGIFVVEGLQADALANGGRLRFQGIGLRALLGQGVSSGPDALLGGGGGLQEIRLLLELSRSLGVGGASRGDFFLVSGRPQWRHREAGPRERRWRRLLQSRH